jgi:hypothetical protein
MRLSSKIEGGGVIMSPVVGSTSPTLVPVTGICIAIDEVEALRRLGAGADAAAGAPPKAKAAATATEDEGIRSKLAEDTLPATCAAADATAAAKAAEADGTDIPDELLALEVEIDLEGNAAKAAMVAADSGSSVKSVSLVASVCLCFCSRGEMATGAEFERCVGS